MAVPESSNLRTTGCRRNAQAGADAAFQRLIGEPLALAVDGPGVGEHVHADLADAERRSERQPHFDGARDERVADGGARLEPAEVCETAEHRLQIHRPRL